MVGVWALQGADAVLVGSLGGVWACLGAGYMTRRFVVKLWALWLVGLLVFAAAAVAEPVVQPGGLHEVPWFQVLIGVSLACWGGLARTVARIAVIGPEVRSAQLVREAVNDLSSAAVVGCVVVGAAQWLAWPVWGLVAILPIAGYGGAKWLSAITEAAWSKVADRLGGERAKAD